MKRNKIPSVNLHLTKACNMKCKYCFACFKNTERTYPTHETFELINLLKAAGFEKINFVGGEPMLIPNLTELIKYSKSLGFYTSIVTNGSLITSDFLEQTYLYLDSIGLSIDSLVEETNIKIGRKSNRKAMNETEYLRIIEMINYFGIEVKINIVVSKMNLNEDFYTFINKVNPMRWKLFQVLPVTGENDEGFERFSISKEEFDAFNNFQISQLDRPKIAVKEENDVIRGSYVMINPNGQFFDNTKGYYTESENIIEVGVEEALSQINFDIEKFIKRDGHYYSKLSKSKMLC